MNSQRLTLKKLLVGLIWQIKLWRNKATLESSARYYRQLNHNKVLSWSLLIGHSCFHFYALLDLDPIIAILLGPIYLVSNHLLRCLKQDPILLHSQSKLIAVASQCTWWSVIMKAIIAPTSSIVRNKYQIKANNSLI